MTPLGKANQMLNEIVALATVNDISLPKRRYAQVGNAVISCSGVTVTVLGTNPTPWQNFQDFQSPLQMMECNVSVTGTFVVTIARECGGVSDHEGFDDPSKVAKVSAQLETDGELLWEWATNYDAFQSKDWTTRFAIEGELSLASLQMTTGID